MREAKGITEGERWESDGDAMRRALEAERLRKISFTAASKMELGVVGR
jgi:hypothetical protein